MYRRCTHVPMYTVYHAGQPRAGGAAARERRTDGPRDAMELRNGKALSGLPPALAADAEAMRVAARDGPSTQPAV